MMTPTDIEGLVAQRLATAWPGFGLPLPSRPIVEQDRGLVDPEALIILTLLFVRDARLLSDVAEWLRVNGDLLVHQKLATLRRGLPQSQRDRLHANLDAHAAALSRSVARALGTGSRGGGAGLARRGRESRFAPRQQVAKLTRMLGNRLFFGAGFRADVVSVLECHVRPSSGRELARLLAANPSTVSRILADLAACGFVDNKGRMIGHQPAFPGVFISCTTARHLGAIIDAARATDPDLRRAMLPTLEPEFDGLGAAVLASATS